MTPSNMLALGQIGLLLAYFFQALRISSMERRQRRFLDALSRVVNKDSDGLH